MRSEPSCAPACAHVNASVARRRRKNCFTSRRYSNPLDRLEAQSLDAIHVEAFEPRGDLAPAGGPGIGLQDVAAFPGELLEPRGHGCLLLRKDTPYRRFSAQS